MKRPLCVAVMCAAAAPCLAAEGFFTDDKPPAVRAIWPAVYAFVCEGRKGAYTASAFLVAARERGKGADYYFVTAGHAIEECKGPRRYLVQNINQRTFEADGITVAAPSLRLDGVKPVRIDEAYDIAVVKVEARAKLGVGDPVAIGDACERSLGREVFAVGFPGVEKRRSLRLKRQEKRWSRGDFVGLGKAEFRGSSSLYIATSVDSLPGNSGGPVVDAAGTFIGVVAQGAAGADNRFRYDVDPRNPRDWQTFLVPCDAVRRLLQKSGLE